MAITFGFLQSAVTGDNLSAYTFADQSLGDADADRYIIVGASSRCAGTAITLTSISIGGVTATILINGRHAVSNSTFAALAIAKVPTGTTGDIVVTYSGTMVRAGIGVWRAIGINATPTDTDSSVEAAPVGTIDIKAGGCAIGVAAGGSDVTTAAWTNLTEKYDERMGGAAETTQHTGASDEFASEQTGRQITCTFSASVIERVGVFASFEEDGEAPAVTNPKIKLAGTFTSKPLKIKLAGTFVEKPLKVKVGGVFV